jgi:predicted DNA-binding protein
MNVKLKLETERRFAELATQTGRAPGEVLEDMIEGYFEEADALRAMIDSRYDDAVNGRVELVGADEVRALMKAKIAAHAHQ